MRFVRRARQRLTGRPLVKGGKQGRKRRTAGGGASPGAPKRGTGKAPGSGRPASAAPKKGERRKPFGGRSSSGDEQ